MIRRLATITELRPHPEASPKKRVLVVEDNLDTVHSTAMLIKMNGHECQFAINGFAALDLARSFRPDVILLDIGLPDFKGYEIARQLKWEPTLAKTRIIAITGLPMRDVRDCALEAGCEEVLSKPVAPAKLEEVIQKTTE